jgi:hypothetical protein
MSDKKDNSGVLFRNTRKESDKHPDYTGSATINGVDMWISAWVNETKDGSKKYFAMNFRLKAEQTQAESIPNPPPINGGNMIDDLPF